MPASIRSSSDRGQSAAAQTSEVDRWIKIGILGVGAVLLLLALLMGGWVTKVFVAIVVFSTWQGLWRGAAEAIGLVVATLLAVLLAPSIGKGMEGVVGGVLGTSGMLNRIISIALVGLGIIAVVGVGGGMVVKRVLKDKAAWKRWNPFAGAALGAVEGVMLGLGMMWAVLAIAPIASDQVAHPGVSAEDGSALPMNQRAERLVRFAEDVRGSALGGIAETTNPIEGSRLMKIMQDFAAISKDPEAVRAFVDSEAMKRIANMPSIQRAKEMIDKDPQLGSLVSAQGMSVSSLRLILESDTLLKILDETGVVGDVTPMAAQLEAAVQEARKKVKDR